MEVSWRSKKYQLLREDGIIGLTRIKGHGAVEAHKSLLKALEDDSPSIRVSALKALPEVATQKSDELFDWLSVLLDDDDLSGQKNGKLKLYLFLPRYFHQVLT